MSVNQLKSSRTRLAVIFQKGFCIWSELFTQCLANWDWRGGLSHTWVCVFEGEYVVGQENQTWKAFLPLGDETQVTERWSTRSRACSAHDPNTNLRLGEERERAL